MSSEPVTLLVARHVHAGRYDDFLAWIREGERLAADFPGYLGSGMLAPADAGGEYQIICRFADEASLDAWERSASRRAWLARGDGLFDHPHAHRALGDVAWFGAPDLQPPRWKRTVAIWLAFFPVSLAFQLTLGETFAELATLPRVLLTTLLLTPLMTYGFIPLSTRLLGNWLRPRAPREPARRPADLRPRHG